METTAHGDNRKKKYHEPPEEYNGLLTFAKIGFGIEPNLRRKQRMAAAMSLQGTTVQRMTSTPVK